MIVVSKWTSSVLQSWLLPTAIPCPRTAITVPIFWISPRRLTASIQSFMACQSKSSLWHSAKRLTHCNSNNTKMYSTFFARILTCGTQSESFMTRAQWIERSIVCASRVMFLKAMARCGFGPRLSEMIRIGCSSRRMASTPISRRTPPTTWISASVALIPRSICWAQTITVTSIACGPLSVVQAITQMRTSKCSSARWSRSREVAKK